MFILRFIAVKSLTEIEEELFYLIALSMVNGIGNHLAKNLYNHFGSAKNIFDEKAFNLRKIQGIGTLTAKSI